MAHLEIKLLGGFEVLMNGAAVPIRGSKERALLALLAMSSGVPITRDRLCGILWGDRGDKHAHDSLKQALHRLRSAFHPACPIPIHADRISLVLNLDRGNVDACCLERLIGAKSEDERLQVVSHYRGDFLEDLQIREQAFEDWLQTERQRFRFLAINAISNLLDENLHAGAWDQVHRLALKLLDVDPLHELAHRALMQSSAKQGRSGEALEQYRRCAQRLKEELGVKPEALTERLYRSILLGRSGAPAPRPEIRAGESRDQSAGFIAREITLRANALSWDDPNLAACAKRALERAIRLDPGYARPRSLLATILGREWRNSFSDSRRDLDRALALAQRAVEIGASESTSFTTLGYIQFERRNFRDARRFMERGLDLDPGNPWIQIDLGYFYSYTGRAEEACARLEAARQLDPGLGPSWYWRSLGLAHFVERRYEAALGCFELAHFDRAGFDLETCQSPGYAKLVAAACFARLGDRARARAIVDRAVHGRSNAAAQLLVDKIPFEREPDRRHLLDALHLSEDRH